MSKVKTRTNQPVYGVEDDVKQVIENAESGTIQDVLGLDEDGVLVKGNSPIFKTSDFILDISQLGNSTIVITGPKGVVIKSISLTLFDNDNHSYLVSASIKENLSDGVLNYILDDVSSDITDLSLSLDSYSFTDDNPAYLRLVDNAEELGNLDITSYIIQTLIYDNVVGAVEL